MAPKEEVVVMYESDEAAQKKTITGWVSRDGRYWGNDEHMARYAGATHKLCECGGVMKIGYTVCEKCQAVKRRERYRAMPFQEWDGATFVTTYDDDKYFNSPDDIEEYCRENNVDPADLMLVICTPNSYCGVDSDIWQDVLPEDGDIPDSLQKKIDELNTFIGTLGPASWSAGKNRTDYDCPARTNEEVARLLMREILYDNNMVSRGEPENEASYPLEHVKAIAAACAVFFGENNIKPYDCTIEIIATEDIGEKEVRFGDCKGWKELNDTLNEFFDPGSTKPQP